MILILAKSPYTLNAMPRNLERKWNLSKRFIFQKKNATLQYDTLLCFAKILETDKDCLI